MPLQEEHGSKGQREKHQSSTSSANCQVLPGRRFCKTAEANNQVVTRWSENISIQAKVRKKVLLPLASSIGRRFCKLNNSTAGPKRNVHMMRSTKFHGWTKVHNKACRVSEGAHGPTRQYNQHQLVGTKKRWVERTMTS